MAAKAYAAPSCGFLLNVVSPIFAASDQRQDTAIPNTINDIARCAQAGEALGNQWDPLPIG
jgi:hypothetical protein